MTAELPPPGTQHYPPPCVLYYRLAFKNSEGGKLMFREVEVSGTSIHDCRMRLRDWASKNIPDGAAETYHIRPIQSSEVRDRAVMVVIPLMPAAPHGLD